MKAGSPQRRRGLTQSSRDSKSSDAEDDAIEKKLTDSKLDRSTTRE